MILLAAKRRPRFLSGTGSQERAPLAAACLCTEARFLFLPWNATEKKTRKKRERERERERRKNKPCAHRQVLEFTSHLFCLHVPTTTARETGVERPNMCSRVSYDLKDPSMRGLTPRSGKSLDQFSTSFTSAVSSSAELSGHVQKFHQLFFQPFALDQVPPHRI